MKWLKRVLFRRPANLLFAVVVLVVTTMGSILLLQQAQPVEATNDLSTALNVSACPGCEELVTNESGSHRAAVQLTPTVTATVTSTETPEPTVTATVTSTETPEPTVTPSPTGTPLPPINVRIKFEGIIQSIDNSQTPAVWVINGLTVLVTPDTEIDEEHGPAQVGAWVKVKAHLEPASDGTSYVIVADEIEVKRSPGACFKVEFYGELMSITTDDSGQTVWIVSGHTVIITAETQIEGTPEVGAIVKIEGCAQPDGSVIATEVEVRRPPGEGGEEVEFRGPIVEMTDGQWQVGRWIVLITDSTQISGDPPDVGDLAEVHGYLNAQGQVVAKEIEVKDVGRARNLHVRIEGYVTGITDAEWQIQGIPVQVTEATIVVGVPPAEGVWAVADVMVQTPTTSTQRNGVTYVAMRIRTRRSDKPADALKFQGVLESQNANGTWTVSGWNFIVNEGTKLEKNPQVGDWVEVDASYNSQDGTYTALEIEAKKEGDGGGHGRPHGGVKIEGRVTTMDTDTGQWAIEGIPVEITPQTIIDERDTDINVGTWVEVKAMARSGQPYLALVVEAKDEAELPEGQLKFKGRLESQDGGSWVIGGWTFVVDEQTVVNGTPTVGRRVKVTATWNGTSYHANVIEAEGHHGS